MKKLLFLFWLGHFTVAFAAVPELWIVGDNYLGYVAPGQAPVYFPGVRAASHGVDAGACRLWITQEDDPALRSWTANGPELEAPSAGMILSDVQDGVLVTRNAQATHLEKRNGADGKILELIAAPWIVHTERIVAGAAHEWALNVDGTQLSVRQLDRGYQETKQVVIATGIEVWGFRKLEFDWQSGNLWAGFTRTVPAKAYSPAVQRLAPDGTLGLKHGWEERGLFFDSCLEINGDVLVARDIPSDSGFTVPVHSFLERVSPLGKASTYYAGSTNDFIDALVCVPRQIFMVQRSIFGSDGSYLVDWDRTPGTLGNRLFKLPGQAKELYSCR